MENDDDQSLDDVLNDMGIGKADKPFEPEEKFLREITFGSVPRITNLYHSLRQDMSRYNFMTKEGIRFIKLSKELTRIQYAALMIEHFLWACFLTRFHYMGLDGLEKEKICDMKKVVDMILDLEETKKEVWFEKK